MTDKTSQSAAPQGKFRRAVAAFSAFLEAMDYTSADYAVDRINGLEQEIRRLREEIREGRTSAH